ncbi:interleukin-6 receptor subunit alpha isoform X2 [Mastacembelus armatus]|uniref:interleukin-6 receptor subunit alpha isoform X2 n=1 Tax=Mastacembelus armatus TaxID=205130 RepID=UPI000E46368A|nr:interleukin-6 receptor subunit alpha-like isoform X2 [Mastacembelus armatus]
MRKMRIFLPLLCILCGAQVHSIFDGSCHRKDPPPGVLVLSPGSKLVLTCRGQVMVNGVKVNIARNNSSTSQRETSSVAPTTTGNNKHNTNNAINEGHEAKVSTVTGKNRIPRHTDTGYTASPTPHMGQPTSVSRTLKDESDLEAEKMDGEGFYEEDEEEEEGADGRRVTRGITSSPQWKWNGRAVEKAKRDRGEIIFERRGTMLSLSSVRVTDSGNYTCHHRGRVRFSLKVIVTEPPENPRLSCYKKSPSSKIRCEWAPQKPVSRQPDAYLVLRKRSTDTEFNLPCSYSSRLSRYWCALEHNEDDLRILHMAYLCVRNIAGSAISNMLPFIPLDILKPNPPSDVKVQQKEGCETCLKVTWNFPSSWKPQDSYYYLVYELKYQPLMSIFYQIKEVSDGCSYTINDVLTGIEYLIQVRTKEEYDGHWSDWSPPVKAFSWTDPNFSDVSTTMFTLSVTEGSTDDFTTQARWVLTGNHVIIITESQQ